MYPRMLATGCILWFTGRRVYNRGALDCISGSLRYPVEGDDNLYVLLIEGIGRSRLLSNFVPFRKRGDKKQCHL